MWVSLCVFIYTINFLSLLGPFGIPRLHLPASWIAPWACSAAGPACSPAAVSLALSWRPSLTDTQLRSPGASESPCWEPEFLPLPQRILVSWFLYWHPSGGPCKVRPGFVPGPGLGLTRQFLSWALAALLFCWALPHLDCVLRGMGGRWLTSYPSSSVLRELAPFLLETSPSQWLPPQPLLLRAPAW